MVIAVMMVMLLPIRPKLVPQANTQKKHGRDDQTKNEIDSQICHDVTSLFI